MQRCEVNLKLQHGKLCWVEDVLIEDESGEYTIFVVKRHEVPTKFAKS